MQVLLAVHVFPPVQAGLQVGSGVQVCVKDPSGALHPPGEPPVTYRVCTPEEGQGSGDQAE